MASRLAPFISVFLCNVQTGPPILTTDECFTFCDGAIRFLLFKISLNTGLSHLHHCPMDVVGDVTDCFCSPLLQCFCQ